MELSDIENEMNGIQAYYAERGLFQGTYGFGKKAAIIVVDFAYGWTDDAYAYGTRRMDEPVRCTRILLDKARELSLPVIYSSATNPDQPLPMNIESPNDEKAKQFRAPDQRSIEIDERLGLQADEVVFNKCSASAFFGTALDSHLRQLEVDTVILAGCQASACVAATATDAQSLRFKPILVDDCIGDRHDSLRTWALLNLKGRTADLLSLDETLKGMVAHYS